MLSKLEVSKNLYERMQYVLDRANQIKKSYYESKPRSVPYNPIRYTSDYVYNQSRSMFGHIIRSDSNDPVRRATLKPHSAMPKLPNRHRVGRQCPSRKTRLRPESLAGGPWAASQRAAHETWEGVANGS